MKVTESERALLHELHSARKKPQGKRILHFFASMLPQNKDTAAKASKARDLLNQCFAKAGYYKLFELNNGDLIILYAHASISTVLAVSKDVEKVFMGDYVLSIRNAYNEYGFNKILDMGKDLDRVLFVIKDIIRLAQPKTDDAKHLTPDKIPDLLDRIGGSDARHCIFNQPVYFLRGAVPSIEFIEFFVSSRQLQQAFLPDTNLLGNPWLFHALKADFDRLTLRTIVDELPGYRHKAFSVNVSLATVLGPDFQSFYEQLPAVVAGRIILEIHKTDLIENMALMRKARAFAASKGIKLCIDGLQWQDFQILRFNHIKPDFVKMIWDDALLTLPEEDLRILVEGIRGLGEHSRAILSRCDDPRSFLLARTLGISLVQGRLADQNFKNGDKM